MQSDDVIWSVIDEQFCSYKARIDAKQQPLCKNDWNLTGECARIYCPLANSRYATIKEEDGILYLFVKTIERAAFPAKLWEKIQLEPEMKDAIDQINGHLMYWPQYMVNKVKERLVRLHQYLIRYRKWYYRAKPRLVEVHKKFERREKSREFKALMAAKLDFAIKAELLERLKKGTYGEMYNLNNRAFQEIIAEEKLRAHMDEPNKHSVRARPTPKDLQAIQRTLRTALKGPAKKEDIEDLVNTEKEDEEEQEQENEADVEEGDGETQFEDVSDSEVVIGDFEDEANEAARATAAEVEQEAGNYDPEDQEDRDRMELLKHIPIDLHPEEGDDEEVAYLKKKLLNTRKRKLQEKQAKNKKLLERLKKGRKDYANHVEIEYETERAPALTRRN